MKEPTADLQPREALGDVLLSLKLYFDSQTGGTA